MRSGRLETSKHSTRDLSEGGACIDRGEHLRVGETVTVTIGQLIAIEAQVRWVDAGFAGLQFANRFSLS